jgi:hypothetical protein
MIGMYNEGRLNAFQMDCFVAPRKAEELFDVVSDPLHFNNLAEDPAHAAALTEMRALLDQWIVTYDDKIPENPTPDQFDRLTGRKL